MRQIIIYHAKRHLSLASLLLLLSIGILTLILVSVVIRPPTAKGVAKTATLHPREVPINNFDVEYPTFGAPADAVLKKFADTKINEFKQKLGHERYDPLNTLTLHYTVVYRDDRFVSVIFTQQEQLAGRPAIVSQRIMTLDLTSGKELGIGDLFKDEATGERRLAMLLYDYLKQNHGSDFTQLQFLAFLQFKLADVKEFWLQDDSVVLQLDPKALHQGRSLRTVAIKRSVMGDVFVVPQATGKSEGVAADYPITETPKPADVIDPNQKMLALTFDDGPGGYTNRVLDALHSYRAHATFFVIGRQVPGQADVMRRMISEGNEIGNHSWDHASLPALTHSQLMQEINDTQNAIRNATGGYAPTQMRPPYGAMNGVVGDFLRSQNLRVALWNVDTEDWLIRDYQQTYDRIMASAGDGRIILLHDIHPTSVEAVERAIPELIGQGYQLVTLSQLEQYRN